MDFHACSERSLLPGDEEAFKSAGRSYRTFAEELWPLASRLRVLAETGLSGAWEGPAGLVFLMYLEILPSNITAYADAHDGAGDALLGVGNELIGRRLIMGRVLTEGRQAQDRLRALQQELRSLMAATSPDPRRVARLESDIRSVQALLRRKEQEMVDEQSVHRELCKRSARRIEDASEIIRRNRDWAELAYQAVVARQDEILLWLGLANDLQRLGMWGGSALIAHFAKNPEWWGRWGAHKRWAIDALRGRLLGGHMKIPFASKLLVAYGYVSDGQEYGYFSTTAVVNLGHNTLGILIPAYGLGSSIGEGLMIYTPIGDNLLESFESDLNNEIDYWIAVQVQASKDKDFKLADEAGKRAQDLCKQLQEKTSGLKGYLNVFKHVINPLNWF